MLFYFKKEMRPVSINFQSIFNKRCWLITGNYIRVKPDSLIEPAI